MSFRPRIATASSGDLPLKSEFHNFLRRWKVIESGLSQLSDPSVRTRIRRAIRDLEALGPALERRLSGSTDPDAAQVSAEFRPVYAVFTQRRDQIRSAVEESEYQFAQPAAPLQESLLVEDDDAEAVAFLQRQATEILGDMRQLSHITEQVADFIQEQHEVVVKVDTTIGDAVEEMKAGNEDLACAEKDQKSSVKLLYIILAVVGAVALIVAGVCIYVFVIKK
jgi:hypothetical protein